MVILDTSILIDFLRSDPDSETILSKIYKRFKEEHFAISILTLQELYQGKSTKRKDVEIELRNLITSLEVLPYNYQVAKTAGELFRDLDRIIDFTDAAIASTCIVNKAYLATLNTKHFKGINYLEVIDLDNFSK